MYKKIHMLIDELFAEMKMTAENLALRDELMANAQARYDDALMQGKSEEAAFAEVAESLGDVHALLEEMREAADRQQEDATPEQEAKAEPQAQDEEAPAKDDNQGEEADEAYRTDLGDALNKAFTALGDFGQAILPEAKKFVREVDGASGGVLSRIGKATQKGLKDAQKAAEEAIDKFAGDKGEIVFDFGPKIEKKEEQEDAGARREQAKDLRAQANIKAVTGDPEGAQALRTQADALDMQADQLELAAAAEAARRAAAEAETGTAEEAQSAAAAEPLTKEDGEVDEDALSRAVEEMAREAEAAAHGAGKTAADA